MLESSTWLAERRQNNFLERTDRYCHILWGSSPPPPVLLPPGKARRLKQAKEEAQMEVEQYRREREQEFQSKQQAVSGGLGGWDGTPGSKWRGIW